MSIGEFSNALKDQAYKQWFKNSTKSIFTQTTDELRPSEETAQKTSFLLRQEDIVAIAEKLAGRAVTSKEIDKIRADLIASVKAKAVIKRKDNSLFFPVIGFKTGISTVLDKGFASLPKTTFTDSKGKTREARVSDFFQKGHVFSIATNIGEQTLRNLQSSKAPDEVKKKLIPVLKEVLAKLKEDDIASSNVGSVGYDLYAKYAKNPYRYIVEMQPEEKNQTSGRASRPFTEGLRRYFKPENYVVLEKFFKTRATEDAFIQKLITSQGSPSMVKLMGMEIASKIASNPKPQKTSYSIPRVKLDTVSRKINTDKVKSTLKTKINQVQQAINTLEQAVKLANTSLQIQEPKSLVTLEALLRSSINSQVAKNMGTGNETRILNYRTGRFAESVAIDRVLSTRDGFVTAFYSYMKNPYATFSAGGRQEYPKTRDPKLLISKSIREIGATLAYTRMRAVNV